MEAPYGGPQCRQLIAGNITNLIARSDASHLSLGFPMFSHHILQGLCRLQQRSGWINLDPMMNFDQGPLLD